MQLLVYLLVFLDGGLCYQLGSRHRIEVHTSQPKISKFPRKGGSSEIPSHLLVCVQLFSDFVKVFAVLQKL